MGIRRVLGLTALEEPLSDQFCNHAELHASGCLPAVGSMPGGMTGENPFATVGTDANLRGNQRQAAALAAGLSPPHQGHVGAINLAPTLVPVAAQQTVTRPRRRNHGFTVGSTAIHTGSWVDA